MKIFCSCLNFFLFILILNFFSCSNSQNLSESNEISETVKSRIIQKKSDSKWTSEIESNLLTEEISKNENISDKVLLSQNAFNSIKNLQVSQYPFIEGFSSLDDSNLNSTLKTSANDFCTHLSKNFYDSADSFIKDGYFFTYVFFQEEIINGWKKYFLKDFPLQKNEEQLQELFEYWIFGSPFVSSDLVELPVRFYCSEGFFDVKIIYVNSNGFKITQIKITGWNQNE